MSNKIGFYIGQGVEIRHFILSGLFQKAAENGEAIIIMKNDMDSNYLKDYVEADKIIYLPDFKEIKKRHFIETYVSGIRMARLRFKKIGNFHHFSERGKSNFIKDFLLGNPVTFYLFTLFSLPFLKRYYTSNELVKIFKENNLTTIFLVDYNTPFYLQIGYSANEAKVDMKIIINTLKSFYINDFVPFKIKSLYAWNENQNNLFKQSNFHQSSNSFLALGNPFHNFILNPIDLTVIDKELKEIEHTPFIVYSLIFEKVFSGEYEVLSLINSFINDNFTVNKPKIIVRRNPFEQTQIHIEKIRQLNNVIIAPHTWERKAEKEWSIQSYKGEAEWKFLLSKAKLLINITSMAAVESIVSGTPVINIGFNGQGIQEPLLKRFSNAPFLSDILVSKYVQLAINFEDFKNIFFELYNKKQEINKAEIVNSMNISIIKNASIYSMVN